MVKATGQIEKELKLLQQRTQDMAEVLDPLYDGYLRALGEASSRQLVSAVYHLCTQAYPDKFVALSWQQRNELQKSLQAIASSIHDKLLDHRGRAKKMSRRQQQSSGLAFLQRLLEARTAGAVITTSKRGEEELLEKLSALANADRKGNRADEEDLSDRASQPQEEAQEPADWPEDDGLDAESTDDLREENLDEALDVDSDRTLDGFEFSPFDLDGVEEGETANEGLTAEDDEPFDFDVDVPAAEQRLSAEEEEDLLSALEGLARRSLALDETAEDDSQPLAPIHLVRQQVLLEKSIRDVFKSISEDVNSLLQKSNVMPSFPKALMAAASDARGLGEPSDTVPNVVKVSVRVMHGEANFLMDDEDDSERRRPESGRSNSGRSDSDSRYRRSRQRAERPSRKRSRAERSPRDMRDMKERLLSREAIEIESLPEFAVVNLQLSEVEFADPTVSVWRSRLRKELANLKQLGIRYKKTQRSLETSQAEDAWRSSWTVHSPEEE